MKDCNKEIGDRVGKVRAKMGESQADLAAALGVKRQMVTYWENGTRPIKAETIIKISERYNVSTDYLLCRSDYPATNEDIKTVIKATGLSEETVLSLKKFPAISETLNDFIPSFGFGFSLELLRVRSTIKKAIADFELLKEKISVSNDIDVYLDNETEFHGISDAIDISLYSFEKYCRHLPDIYGVSDFMEEAEKYEVEIINKLGSGGSHDGKHK